MASNEQSVTLLRKNKRAQVDALNSLGFNLTEGARASQFPMLVKWAAGLLDVTLAANRKGDNRKFFFTLAEWQSLSSSEQDMFLLRGVRVRACGVSFVVAPDNIPNKAWGSKKSVANAYVQSSKKDLYKYFNALEETQNIVDFFDGVTADNVAGAPAAEAALAYKTFTLERDGLEDDTQWAMPTQAHLRICFRFRAEIETIFLAVWSAECKFLNQIYHACIQYDTTNSYRTDFSSGYMYTGAKTDIGVVRPISVE